MNVTLYPFQPIPITPERPTIIETNNQTVLKQLLLNCHDLADDLHFSTDDYDLIPTHKAFWWLGDTYLNQDLDKLFQHQLYKSLLSLIAPHDLQEILESARQLQQQVLEKTYLLDLPLIINPEVELGAILKLCDLKFDRGLLKSAYAIIEAIIKTASELDEKRILGFQNITDYLTNVEFSDLVQLISQLKLPVLIIKFSEIQRSENFKNCRYLYIDQDFVDWRSF